MLVHRGDELACRMLLLACRRSARRRLAHRTSSTSTSKCIDSNAHARAEGKSQRLALSELKTKKYEIMDADANLTHPKLLEEIDVHMQRAKDVGVCGFIVPGTTVKSSLLAHSLSKQFSGIFPTLGIHPYSAAEELGEVAALKAHIQDGDLNFFAIGECGLDYTEGFPSKDAQLEVFRPQVQLAVATGMPLFLHERLAFDDFVRVLDEYRPAPERVLIHCFTGNSAELAEYVARGYYISLSGLLCNSKRGESLRAAVKATRIPLTRIMIETDAPYLGFKNCRAGYSMSKKTFPNVPSALPFVLDALAACMNVPAHELAIHTLENTKRFLGI